MEEKRSRGRPQKDVSDRHCHQYRLRLNDEEWEMLQYLEKLSPKTANSCVASRLRLTIKAMYEEFYEEEPTEVEKKMAQNLGPALLAFADCLKSYDQINTPKQQPL